MNEVYKRKPKAYQPGFQFSQGSLQAFEDCPRLFQLRYLKKVSWPVNEQESSKQLDKQLEQGTVFHHWIHQFYRGISPERLVDSSPPESQLARWWRFFLDHRPKLENYLLYPEISLSIPIGSDRLVAKFDLLAINRNLLSNSSFEINEAVIVDWKTSRKRPNRPWQRERLQSKVYPYLFVAASSQFTEGKNIEPNHLKMIYWFSNAPTSPMEFSYNNDQYQKDKDYINTLIRRIKKLGPDEAPKTTKIKRCSFCIYRSLCDRGTEDGFSGDEFDLDQVQAISTGSLDDFDFDQIAEIEF